MSITSYLIRKAFGKHDKKRDAGLSAPDTMKRFENIQYGPDRKWQVLDVYRPLCEEGPLPVIINVHGGGMVYGDKELYRYYCMELAGHGFAVINFTYRLAPESKFPSALEDTALVFAWAQKNSSEYGFDMDHLFAVGDSAGANLLGLYCCIYTNPDYAKNFSFAALLCPKAVVLNCGVYHYTYSRRKDLTSFLMANLMPRKGTPEEYRLLCVDEFVNGNFPPAFIMTGEGDFLADQARPFYEILNRLGVAAQYHYYGDAEHILGHVFQCNIRLPQAIECMQDECAFLKSHS